MDTQELAREMKATPLSMRQMNKVIRKLRLQDDDVILIKEGTEMAKKNNMDALATAIGKSGIEGVIVIVVQSIDDIQSLGANEMQRYGWYKFKNAAELIMDRLYKKEQEDDEEENGL